MLDHDWTEADWHEYMNNPNWIPPWENVKVGNHSSIQFEVVSSKYTVYNFQHLRPKHRRSSRTCTVHTHAAVLLQLPSPIPPSSSCRMVGPAQVPRWSGVKRTGRTTCVTIQIGLILIGDMLRWDTCRTSFKSMFSMQSSFYRRLSVVNCELANAFDKQISSVEADQKTWPDKSPARHEAFESCSS